jgi:biotin carboxyl carrier protein
VEDEPDGLVEVAALTDGQWRVTAQGSETVLRLQREGARLQVEADGHINQGFAVVSESEVQLFLNGARHRFELRHWSPSPAAAATAAGWTGRIAATMPGVVTEVHVSVGDTVEPGDLLGVIESMKLLHAVKAPQSGMVENVDVGLGDAVEIGQAIFVISAPADTEPSPEGNS